MNKLRVDLTYFTITGKYYTDAEYETDKKDLWQIWDEVQEMMDVRCTPGLRRGHSLYIVLVDVPDHPNRHPHLVMGEVIEDE
jgi:hypothetical protein